MWTENFQKFKLNLGKAEEPEVKLPTPTGSYKNQEKSRKTSPYALLTVPKPLTVWITTNCGKFFYFFNFFYFSTLQYCIGFRKFLKTRYLLSKHNGGTGIWETFPYSFMCCFHKASMFKIKIKMKMIWDIISLIYEYFVHATCVFMSSIWCLLRCFLYIHFTFLLAQYLFYMKFEMTSFFSNELFSS